jgi:hypothetical protein
MPVLVRSSQLFKYRPAEYDGVDITRSGCTTTRREGKDAPGEIWAPSAALVYPAVEAMKAARQLMHVGTSAVVPSYVLQQSTEMSLGNGYRKIPHEVQPSAARESGYDQMHLALEQIIATWSAYETSFMLEMRASYKKNRRMWEWFLDQKQITILCRCEDFMHCHRRILRRVILPALGAIDGGEMRPDAEGY